MRNGRGELLGCFGKINRIIHYYKLASTNTPVSHELNQVSNFQEDLSFFIAHKIHSSHLRFVSISINHFLAKSGKIRGPFSHAEMFTINAHALLIERQD